MSDVEYDSELDTRKHIALVSNYLNKFAIEMIRRGMVHDASKLLTPEKEAFDRESLKLKTLEYDSDEYKASLSRLGDALQHHYENNSHHPEYYGELKVYGMDLFDVVEMFFDWLAASKRNQGGFDVTRNVDKFEIVGQLESIFNNTKDRMKDYGIT